MCIYLPKYRFSSNIKEPAMATSTSIRGLKAEVYSGPLIPTHHAMTITIIPEATIPCKNTKLNSPCYKLTYQIMLTNNYEKIN